jgi:alkanesulfonate monooxygenase SsuD/methylene tetrahydromethanopterin reductase-like flavin-dependent oxidoreductase (luciferase family)
MVLCQSFRNPGLLGKMAATLQYLSGGRYTLGLGAGWHAEEYAAYGYDFPPNPTRVEQLEETIQVIRALWTQSPATFKGKHYRVSGAYCHPRPSPHPPLIVGAFRPRMLRLAAQYADGWNVSSTSARAYQSLAAAFDRACAQIGRDPLTLSAPPGKSAPSCASSRLWASPTLCSTAASPT